MANTYHQIYLQIVFAVKYRKAVIDKSWGSVLNGIIGNLITENKCKTIIVNGVEDHLHCFVGLKPVVLVSDLMKSVKALSSKYINDHSLSPARFEWQEGYGVFSYSKKMSRLKYYLLHAKRDSMRDAITFQLAYRYRFSNIDSSLIYTDQTIAFAERDNFPSVKAQMLSLKGAHILEAGTIAGSLQYQYESLNKV